MPYSCSVPHCNGNYRTGPKVAVFGFPKDPEQLDKWMRAIKRYSKPTPHSKVCEKHFKLDDILREVSCTDMRTGRTLTAPLFTPRLAKNAVPSIFPKQPPKRNPPSKKPNCKVRRKEALGLRERQEHNYCRPSRETLKTKVKDNPHHKESPQPSLTMEVCKQEPMSDSESPCVDLKFEESVTVPQDVSWKQEEDLDIKDHQLAIESPKIKAEPQDDSWSEDEMAVSNEVNPLAMVASTMATIDQNDEDACEKGAIVRVKTENTSEDIASEEMSHYDESIDSYLCKICEVSFKRYQDFQVHLRVHSESYSTEEEEDIKPLLVPVKTEYVGPGFFHCEFCEASFRNESELEIHTIEHTNSLTCRKCTKIFKKKGFLINHLLLCTKKDLYKCHICKKQLPNKQAYDGHIKLHTGDRTLTCHECDKIFTQPNSLNTHVRNIHNNIRPHCCHMCNRSFYSKGYLKKHILIHTGVRPYPCPVCGKSFTQKGSIGKHMILHTGVLPHACEFCNKTFRRKIGLIHHLRRAKHSLPYQCDICNKCFVIQNDFERHLCARNADLKKHVEIIID